jgi:hypothetical protein
MKTHSNNYQTEWSNIIMDAVYNAVNLQMNMEFVPVLSTSGKLVPYTASDPQEDLVPYFIQAVPSFILMECV